MPATATCMTGLAVDDKEGEPIAGAEVDTTGLYYFGSSTGSTGDDGRFYIPVRKSSQVLVSVSHAAEGGASREVMSGAEDTALPPTPGDARCLDIGSFTVRREIVIVPEPTTGGTGGSGGVGSFGGGTVGTELCDNSIDDDGDTLVDCGDPECCVQTQCETSSTCFSGGAIATGPFTYEGQPDGSFSYVVNFSTGSVTMYGVPVDWAWWRGRPLRATAG